MVVTVFFCAMVVHVLVMAMGYGYYMIQGGHLLWAVAIMIFFIISN